MNEDLAVFDRAKSDGWSRVDRQLERAREKLASARHTEEFQSVGHACREVLISLAQAVYVRERHPPVDGIEPSATDSKRMLRAYVAAELRGEDKKEERGHAQSLIDLAHSALDLANKVQHSRGADLRRAAMCIEATAGVVALISITAGQRDKQYTVRELIDRFVGERRLGTSHRYALLRFAAMPIAKKLASKLQPNDVIEHCQYRRDHNVKPPTVAQDLVYIRGVLVTARDVWGWDVAADAVDRAKPMLERAGIIAKSVPRTRVPKREELARLVAYFTEHAKDPRWEIPMNDIMEFALWSARRIGEICSLRWDDVDANRRTCIVRGIKQAKYQDGRDHEFPLLGNAWDVVQRQPRKEGEPRIFPFNGKSAGTAYRRALKDLGIEDMRFDDLRREAARRLFEAGYTFEQVAQVTGHMHLDPLYRRLRESSPDL